MIATASFMIPYPNRTALRAGYFSGLIRDMAATVSVAQRTLLIIRIYFKFRVSKNRLSKKLRNIAKKMNPMIVPSTPKKLISPKCWKNNDFLRL